MGALALHWRLQHGATESVSSVDIEAGMRGQGPVVVVNSSAGVPVVGQNPGLLLHLDIVQVDAVQSVHLQAHHSHCHLPELISTYELSTH